MNTLFILLSLFAGSLLAVQAGANAQLSRAVGSPMAATTLQLGVGAAALLSVVILTGAVSALPLLSGAPWWHIIGGVASAFYVVSTILLFPRIGAVVSVGLFITGQVLASATLDVFGLLGVAASGFTPGIALGAVLVMAGAGLIVRGQEGGSASVGHTGIGWIALALLAGAVLPVQGAVNALLRQDLGGAAFAVALVSFAVAMLTMAAVQLGVSALTNQPRPRLDGVSSMPWWAWLGGFAGAIYVTTVFTAIPAIGAAATVGLTVAGQQIASVLVDKYGWLRLPQRPVSAMRLTGIAVLLLGVATVKFV